MLAAFHRCKRGNARPPDTTYWPLLHGVRSGALREELAYFANCLLGGNKPEIVTPEEALEAVRACLAAAATSFGDIGRVFEVTRKAIKGRLDLQAQCAL